MNMLTEGSVNEGSMHMHKQMFHIRTLHQNSSMIQSRSMRWGNM